MKPPTYIETYNQEVIIARMLTKYLEPYGMDATRDPQGQFSPWDITVRSTTPDLSRRTDICRIDVELKQRADFPDGGIPNAWTNIRLSGDKIMKKTNRGWDVYLLYDDRIHIIGNRVLAKEPRIIWTFYNDVRNIVQAPGEFWKYYKSYPDGNVYFPIPRQHFGIFRTRYEQLAEWCNDIKNEYVAGRMPA